MMISFYPFCYFYIRVDVRVQHVVTFGQPKVTNSAGARAPAFSTLPLLRVIVYPMMLIFDCSHKYIFLITCNSCFVTRHFLMENAIF
jgi:hypothetical protein